MESLDRGKWGGSPPQGPRSPWLYSKYNRGVPVTGNRHRDPGCVGNGPARSSGAGHAVGPRGVERLAARNDEYLTHRLVIYSSNERPRIGTAVKNEAL